MTFKMLEDCNKLSAEIKSKCQ